MHLLSWLLAANLLLSACGGPVQPSEIPSEPPAAPAETPQTGWTRGQILNGETGEIHFSYYLPESYDAGKSYPMMVVMPGYDRMWFGEDSSGSNLDWNGVQVWTELEEELIVVSAQLTDWHETSARQSIELTEYMLEHFSADPDRVYAAGYSAGGETMSRAAALRPDLYAAYLHGASQWDGTYAPLAENRVAGYIFMAENDEYYGSQKARDAYNRLRAAYQEAGISDEEIDDLLRLDIPDNAWFNRQGIYNYHGGESVVFSEKNVQDWILQKKK